MSRGRILAWSVGVYGVAAALGFLFGHFVRGDAMVLAHPAPWLTLSPGWLRHGASLAGGITLALLTLGFTRFTSTRFRWARTLHGAFRELLGDLDDVTVLGLALTSGIGEELFFRGGLQPSIGWVWTSLVFGLVHLGPDRRFLAWTPWAVAMGFLLGGLFELTGSLVGPVVAHVTINYVNLGFIVAWDPRDPTDGEPTAAPRLVGRRERR